MRKLLLVLAFLLVPGLAWAQGCGPSNPNCIVPTAPPGTNNNQAASTAFVQTAVGGGGGGTITINTTPVSGGTNGQCLFISTGTVGAQACSAAASIAVGSTAVGSGTNGYVLYNNAGTLGNYATNGTGNVAFDTSPVFTTPNIGVATATSLNGLTVTTSTGTLTIPNATTFALAGGFNTTLTSTGATNVILPTSGTLATTAQVGLLSSPNTWIADNTYGSPFIPQANYGGSISAALIQGTLGTTGSPTTNPDAPFIFQKTSNIPGNVQLNPTVLVMGFKNASTSTAYISALTSIAQDNVGGSTTFSEAIRGMSILSAGALGSAYGTICSAVANTSVTYTYLIGCEGQVVNNSGVDAPVPGSFNVNSFSASFVSSNSGTNKADAGYVCNHYNTAIVRSCVYIAAGSTDQSALYNAATLVNGIDLSTGVYSSFQIKGVAFTVDGSGNIAGNGLTSTVPINLASGGTNAALVADNGAIPYSTGSAIAFLASTVTASQCLLSGSHAAPTWGACSSGANVSGVSNSDGTLTISPTTGAVVASLALGHANTWTAVQTFTNSDIRLLGSSTGYTIFTSANASASNFTLTFPGVTDTLAVLNAAQTLTNKTISAASNTLTGVASLTAADQTLSGGANVTANNLGTITTGTTTIDCGASPLQYFVNGGASTLAAPANDGSCIIYTLNNGSAGALSFTGFTESTNTGDALTTTNTSKFFISIARINGVSNYVVRALQ
jgi:hypothetical protein